MSLKRKTRVAHSPVRYSQRWRRSTTNVRLDQGTERCSKARFRRRPGHTPASTAQSSCKPAAAVGSGAGSAVAGLAAAAAGLAAVAAEGSVVEGSEAAEEDWRMWQTLAL